MTEQQRTDTVNPDAAPPPPAASKVMVRLDNPLSDLDQAWRFCKNLGASDLLPYTLRGRPADVLAITLYGRELGIGPMQSISAIYVVNGKPQMSSDLWVALARRAGHKVTWGKCDRTSATITIVRADDPAAEHPYTETFTIGDAVQAGLCTLDDDGNVRARKQKNRKSGGTYEEILPWEKWTKRMLMNRAASFAGKAQCPEVALGFGIEGDYDDVEEEQEPLVVTPEMRPQTLTQADLQAQVSEMAADFSTQPQAPIESDDDTVDAEVVDDDPNVPPDPKPTPPPRGKTGPRPAADDDASLFAAADEQAERDLGTGGDA